MVRMHSWTERCRKRFEKMSGNMVSSIISKILQLVKRLWLIATKHFGIKCVDIPKQFAERARAVVEQLLAFLG